MSGVENRWQVFPQNDGLASKLGHLLSTPKLIAQILLNRGIRSLEEAQQFLDPKSTPLSKFPTEWTENLQKLLQKTIENKKEILLYGDYDVDGMTSTAQFMQFLTHCNAKVRYKIPNRFIEGYGLSHHLITALQKKPVDLLITLDCGITNYSEIEAIRNLGTNVVIIDHHTIPNPAPPANCIINPKALEETHPLYPLCTAGIVYILMAELQPKLAPNFKLENELDLVALGTIADIAALTGDNRQLTLRGLKKLSQRNRIGIDELLSQAEFKKKAINTRDIGFTIAPRLNAAGRLKSAEIGVRLLLETERKKATETARILNKLNKQRQQLGESIFKEALEQVETSASTEPIIILSNRGWHPGIIGITASRLVEKTKKPVIMIAIQDDICRASARSIGSINIYEILKAGKPFYTAFGGHKEAAGFSIEESQIPLLKKTLFEEANKKISPKDRCPIIEIDANIPPTELTLSFAEKLTKMEPFGQKNPQAIFYTNQLSVIDSRLVGETGAHLKLTLCDKNSGTIIDGIGFNLKDKLSLIKKRNIELIFYLEINTWQDKKSPQLNLIDIRAPKKTTQP